MKKICFSELMNFFAEFSHQFYVFKAQLKIAVKKKDENNIAFLVQFW